jgi:hypothetical protein
MPVNPWKQFELAPPGVVAAGSGFAAVSRISMLLGMRETAVIPPVVDAKPAGANS